MRQQAGVELIAARKKNSARQVPALVHVPQSAHAQSDAVRSTCVLPSASIAVTPRGFELKVFLTAGICHHRLKVWVIYVRLHVVIAALGNGQCLHSILTPALRSGESGSRR